MPPGRPDIAELAFAIRELTKAIENQEENLEKRLDERFNTLLRQCEKNEELIRESEEALKGLPGEVDKALRELMTKEFGPERSLEMARKILDGLRQGMHLFLGGTLSRNASPSQDGGIVPASAFPVRPPNPYTVASMKEEGETNEEGHSKKRPVTASFSLDKEGKIDISVDKNSRLALAGGIVAAFAALGWLAQVIYNAVHH